MEGRKRADFCLFALSRVSVASCLVNELLTQNELLTADEVAVLLRVDRRTVWRRGQAGELEVVRVGRSLRYRAEPVRRLIYGDALSAPSTQEEESCQ